MGLYNSFGEGHTQLKVGVCSMAHFNIGDSVKDYEIPDGVYLTPDKFAIVVHGGVLVSTTTNVRDKWDNPMDVSDQVKDRNPVIAAMDEVVKKHERDTSV